MFFITWSNVLGRYPFQVKFETVFLSNNILFKLYKRLTNIHDFQKGF